MAVCTYCKQPTILSNFVICNFCEGAVCISCVSRNFMHGIVTEAVNINTYFCSEKCYIASDVSKLAPTVSYPPVPPTTPPNVYHAAVQTSAPAEGCYPAGSSTVASNVYYPPIPSSNVYHPVMLPTAAPNLYYPVMQSTGFQQVSPSPASNVYHSAVPSEAAYNIYRPPLIATTASKKYLLAVPSTGAPNVYPATSSEATLNVYRSSWVPPPESNVYRPGVHPAMVPSVYNPPLLPLTTPFVYRPSVPSATTQREYPPSMPPNVRKAYRPRERATSTHTANQSLVPRTAIDSVLDVHK